MPRPSKKAKTRAATTGVATAMRRGPQERGNRTRKRILEVAEQLFAMHGYSETSLGAIADGVGIHHPGIFHYFRNKSSLYEAVLEAALGELDDVYTAALTSPGTPEERLLAGVLSWAELIEKRPTLANLILRESANTDPGAGPMVVAMMGQRWQALIEGLIREIQPKALPDDIFHFEAAITGSTLFFAVALQRLLYRGSQKGGPHSMARHTELLLASTGALIAKIRDGSSADLP